MKKFLLVLMLVTAFANIYAQDTTGIHYNNEKIGYSRIIGKNVGNIAGAYFTLGLSSAKSNKIIEGNSAETKITDKNPEFVIIFGEDKQTEYIFSNARNVNNLLLIQMDEKKGKRELRTGKYGLTGVKTGVNEEDVIPLAIERIEDNKVKVRPKTSLKKGQYCFYYIGDAPSEESAFNGVFDFSIE